MHDRPAEWPIQVSSRDVDDALVLRVAGRIELGTVGKLQDAIAASFEHASRGPIVIDLGDATFLGSVGLAVLAELATEASRRARPLRIVVGDNQLVSMPFELTGLDTVLAIYPSVAAALEADH